MKSKNVCKIMLIFLCGLVNQSVHSQDDTETVPPDSARIVTWMRKNNIPVCGIVYMDTGNVSIAKVYGVLDQDRPAPINTVFNVASITKTITTMVVLRLVDSGEWNLDEPVYPYWTDPDVKDDPRSKRLTTRHILTHQTGFPNWRWMTPSHKLAFEFEPGTRFRYSGEGMEYLRKALETKFHKSLEELADSLIFRPLQMTDTHYIWNEKMLTDLAVPHNPMGRELEIEKNSTANAADLVKTTVTDYARFMRWVLNGAGLSEKIYQQMTNPWVRISEGKYMGLGWVVYPGLPENQYGLSHSGQDPGVNTIVFLLPQSKRGLLILTNSDNGTQLYTELVKGYLKEQGKAIVSIEMNP